jgi:hypothetical protein
MNEGLKESLKEIVKKSEGIIDNFFDNNKNNVISKELFDEEKNSILYEIENYISIYDKLGFKNMGTTRTEENFLGETTYYTEDVGIKYKIIENLYNMFSHEAITKRLYNKCVKKIFIV